MKDFSIGQKVTYTPTGEKGIIKSMAMSEGYVFVVYSCGDDWAFYQDYTAQRTPVSKLIDGWPKSETL